MNYAMPSRKTIIGEKLLLFKISALLSYGNQYENDRRAAAAAAAAQ